MLGVEAIGQGLPLNVHFHDFYRAVSMILRIEMLQMRLVYEQCGSHAHYYFYSKPSSFYRIGVGCATASLERLLFQSFFGIPFFFGKTTRSVPSRYLGRIFGNFPGLSIFSFTLSHPLAVCFPRVRGFV